MSAPLVIRFGAIGDLIVTTPLLRALARKYDGACEVIARGEWPLRVFANLPYVQTIKTIYQKKLPFQLARDQKELVRWLKERGSGPVVLLETDRQSNRLIDRAGLQGILSSRDIPRNADEHIIDYFGRMCGFNAGDPNFERWPELRVAEDEQDRCRKWLSRENLQHHPLVLIQAGNRKTGKLFRKTRKDWPIERWVGVIRNVLDLLPDARLLLCGTPQEKWMTSQIHQQTGDSRVVDIGGDLDLRSLFALICEAHSVISVDTGPAHAAGALNCPIVVLFGETDPRDISPVSRTSPVKIVTGPPGAPEPPGKQEWARYHSMEGISVDAVTSAWKKLL
jgi:heptosyltransferase-3